MCDSPSYRTLFFHGIEARGPYDRKMALQVERDFFSGCTYSQRILHYGKTHSGQPGRGDAPRE